LFDYREKILNERIASDRITWNFKESEKQGIKDGFGLLETHHIAGSTDDGIVTYRIIQDYSGEGPVCNDDGDIW
jgi:hypothetical protein